MNGGSSKRFNRAMIGYVLQANGLRALVSEPIDSPQVVSFAIHLAAGTKPEKVKALADALAMATGAPEEVRLTRQGMALLLEIPKRKPQVLPVTAFERQLKSQASTYSVALGVGTDGQVVRWDMAGPENPHLLIAGASGSGKTVALHWLVYRLLVQNEPARLRLLLCDPKGGELEPFRHVAHLAQPVVSTSEDIVGVLSWARAQITQRVAERQGPGSMARLVVVIDEASALTLDDKRIRGLLEQITQLGRGPGVHVVATTQHPRAEDLGTLGIANFPARLVGSVASGTLAYSAAGRAQTMVERLRGKGDFIYLPRGSRMYRLQIPLFDVWDARFGPEIRDRLARLPHADAPALEVPATLPIADGRGGWNRKELSAGILADLGAAFSGGATAAQVAKTFGLNYERAKRLHESFWNEGEAWPPQE
jgi:S-DNA-T family DNA segregation ATPase FtsK/SpoIIIE